LDVEGETFLGPAGEIMRWQRTVHRKPSARANVRVGGRQHACATRASASPVP
jgi:hypothetical protein